ncbi:MAG: hypothetical protein R3F34_14660 [Planctomycetota bacterium]
MPSKSPKRRSRSNPDKTATRRGRWSSEELAFLKEHYALRPEEWIAQQLGRPVESVRRAAQNAFAARARKGPWSDEEVDRLKNYLGATPVEVIARVVGRPQRDVERQIEKLDRVRRSGRWSHDEVQHLRRIYGRRTDEDLARIFGRSVDSIRRQAGKFALAKDKAFVRRIVGPAATRMPRWTEEDLEKLRELYASTPNLEIAKALSRSVKSVVSKAHHLGLKKDEDRLREMGRENVKRRYQRS